jgi:hypothetical protein
MTVNKISFVAKDLHLYKEVDYTPCNENWFYSYVDITNWKSIQQEILELYNKDELISEFVNSNPYYFNLKAQMVLEHCPMLKEFLNEYELLAKFDRILFSSKNTNIFIEKPNPPHTDSIDGELKYSLNIPLVDYERSYLVWSKPLNGKVLWNPKHSSAWTYSDNISELCRVEYSKPMLVNVTLLHNVSMISKPTRSICGIRFSPELTDEELKRLGVVIPK